MHTPGPWEVDERNRQVLIPTGKHSCYAAYAGTLSNARLIAAAPDLLEALEDSRDAINSLPVESLGYAIDSAGRWPIKKELLYKIDLAIEKAKP